MPSLTERLRASRLLYPLLFLLLSPTLLHAADGDMLELWFEYNGRPVTLDNDPQITCLQQPGAVPVRCKTYRSEDGRYWIERPAPGRYLLQISVDRNRANPPRRAGDLYREYPLRLDAATTGPLLIALNRLLALQQPVDGSAPLASGCDGMDDYSAALLALFPEATMRFAWQPLESDARYRYKIWRVRCSDDMVLEQVLFQQTPQAQISEGLAPNRDGEYYRFEVTAVNARQQIGQLLLRDDRGGSSNAYTFVVSDPLIDRTWLYYLMAVLVVLFMLWVLVGAWRGRGRAKAIPEPDDIRRPRSWRPLALVLLLGAVAAGYWQRERLNQEWERHAPQLAQLEEQLRAWLGEEATATPPQADEARAAASAGIPRGQWRGVIVSATRQPFVGEGRRAELRLNFSGERVAVEWLNQGRWQALSRDGFRLQRAAAGLTLFGHRRSDGVSELWTLTIPELEGSTLRISLDRMVTRRDAAGEAVATERRRAGGEIRRMAPE